jgi:hypothetical protein
MPSLQYLDIMQNSLLPFKALGTVPIHCTDLQTLAMDTSPADVKAFLQRQSAFYPASAILTSKFKKQSDSWDFSHAELMWFV